MQEQLEEIHELFKTFIKDHRPEMDLTTVATGEYWQGLRAKALGLIDEIGTSDDWLLTRSKEADLIRVQWKYPPPLVENFAVLSTQPLEAPPTPRVRPSSSLATFKVNPHQNVCLAHPVLCRLRHMAQTYVEQSEGALGGACSHKNWGGSCTLAGQCSECRCAPPQSTHESSVSKRPPYAMPTFTIEPVCRLYGFWLRQSGSMSTEIHRL